jgi:hypothetical protein
VDIRAYLDTLFTVVLTSDNYHYLLGFMVGGVKKANSVVQARISYII